ncbi:MULTISPECIES: substrate-binding domain-containing protein [Asticcacaulis]|uniref:substrate-binding domain-containing protein n=1 Tax=Asticcacaulis TaxID=76890 RepID=UPI001AE8B94A|nr:MULTISPECIES: substrate-binding domain-containing protein [Asticcacaulis]MBP2161058.1 ribose transport system substrate-binding protein/inositol transport system substrate-binding protein [Asticcacaulis solisilvae]MDR6802103.1 ribose transport system substrate-binding protein/inositol transport system substrate-binding protein [Asticcacaulis sp. BE141]
MKKTALLTALLVGALAVSPAFAKTRIFLSMAKTNDKFIGILKNSVEAEAVKDSNIELIVADAKNDEATQVKQVKDAIADKVDAVIILTVNTGSAKSVAELTSKAGTPLIYLNRRPPIERFNGKVAIVSSNDLVAGRLQMRLVADKIGNAGNVAILRGEDGHPAATERTQGVKEILASKPNITLVEEATGNWDRAQGEALVTQWLQGGKPINAVLANNDEMALGAIDALKKAGKKPGEVYVAGVDGTADALVAINSGYLTLSLLQNARAQGAQSLADAKKFIGKEYAELYDWVPYELIIPSNVQQYAGQ